MRKRSQRLGVPVCRCVSRFAGPPTSRGAHSAEAAAGPHPARRACLVGLTEATSCPKPSIPRTAGDRACGAQLPRAGAKYRRRPEALDPRLTTPAAVGRAVPAALPTAAAAQPPCASGTTVSRCARRCCRRSLRRPAHGGDARGARRLDATARLRVSRDPAEILVSRAGRQSRAGARCRSRRTYADPFDINASVERYT